MDLQDAKDKLGCPLAILWQLAFAGGAAICLTRMISAHHEAPDYLLVASAIALTVSAGPMLLLFFLPERKTKWWMAESKTKWWRSYFLSVFGAGATLGLLGIGSGFGWWMRFTGTELALLCMVGMGTAVAFRWIWDERTRREDINTLDLADGLDCLKECFETAAEAMRRLAGTSADDSLKVALAAGNIIDRLDGLLEAHRNICNKMRRSFNSGVLFVPESVRFRCYRAIDSVGRVARESRDRYAELKKEHALLPHTTHVQFDEVMANILPKLAELTEELRGASRPAEDRAATQPASARLQNDAGPSNLQTSRSKGEVRVQPPAAALPEPARLVTSADRRVELAPDDEEAEREAEAEAVLTATPRAGRTQ